MRCIHCKNDAKYQDRSSGKCPICHRPFAFEPKKGDRMTDMAFKTAIDAVSANSRLRWGVEHLYYEVCRRLRRTQWSSWGMFVVLSFLSIILALVIKSLWPLVFTAVGVPLWHLLRAKARSSVAKLNKAVFDSMWRKWLAAHGQPDGVILRKDAPPPKREKEPDLGDYSFDRAVICDRARTVDLLLANNFHFENNCAVLSASGYPPGPFETVRTMLRRNPRLQVFVLHDATVEGCRLAHLLANSPDWFKGQGEVTDVGLRPRHRKPFKGLYLRSNAAVSAVGDGLTPEEAEWLGKYSLELAAIRPEQTLKRLYRAINRKADMARPEKDFGDVGVEFDDDSFSADAGASEGGADGFG